MYTFGRYSCLYGACMYMCDENIFNLHPTNERKLLRPNERSRSGQRHWYMRIHPIEFSLNHPKTCREELFAFRLGSHHSTFDSRGCSHPLLLYTPLELQNVPSHSSTSAHPRRRSAHPCCLCAVHGTWMASESHSSIHRRWKPTMLISLSRNIPSRSDADPLRVSYSLTFSLSLPHTVPCLSAPSKQILYALQREAYLCFYARRNANSRSATTNLALRQSVSRQSAAEPFGNPYTLLRLPTVKYKKIHNKNQTKIPCCILALSINLHSSLRALVACRWNTNKYWILYHTLTWYIHK